jgi:hypothetical protein
MSGSALMAVLVGNVCSFPQITEVESGKVATVVLKSSQNSYLRVSH